MTLGTSFGASFYYKNSPPPPQLLHEKDVSVRIKVIASGERSSHLPKTYYTIEMGKKCNAV
jgi:hypothetical protein